jgi:acetoin utilization protein AcuB
VSAKATVAEWMSTDSRSVDMDAPLGAIRELMSMYGCHHLLVKDAGVVVGVISDRDVLRNLSPGVDKRFSSRGDIETLEKPAHQIMSRGLQSVPPSSSIPEAAALMLKHHINCLPVIDETGCRGVLTTSDVLRWTAATGE